MRMASESESLRSERQADRLGAVRSVVIGWRLGLNRFLSSTRLFASWGAKQDEESLLASARVLLWTIPNAGHGRHGHCPSVPGRYGNGFRRMAALQFAAAGL